MYNFPDSPTEDQVYTPPDGGQSYIFKSPRWLAVAAESGGGGASIAVQDTPPASPTPGMLWWESDSGNFYLWYDDGTSQQWVQVNIGPGGPAAITDAPNDSNSYVRSALDWVIGYSKAAIDTLLGAKVAKAGDTMTGDLTISKAGPAINLDKPASGSWAYILGRMAAKSRWRIDLGDGSAEGAEGVGSNFNIYRWDNAGTTASLVFNINRIDGIVNMPSGSTTLTPPATDNDTSVATTAHVKAVNALAPVVPNAIGAPAADFNLIVTPGWHYDMPYGGTNGPPAFDNYFVQVLAWGASLTQIAYPYSGGPSFGKGFWYRGRLSGVWSAWRQLAPATAETYNRMVNGAMLISQENGFNASPAAAANVAYYAADQFHSRWSVSPGILSSSLLDADFGPNRSNAMYISVSTPKAALAAGDYAIITTFIEGTRLADLCWGTVTAKSIVLRFMVFTSIGGLYSARISNAALNRVYIAQFTATANVENFIVLSIPGDSQGVWTTDTGVGMRVEWGIAVGSSMVGTAGAWQTANIYGGAGQANGVGAANGFYLGEVGLYADPNKTGLAPPWDVSDIGEEQQACRRYYAKYDTSFIVGFTSGAASQSVYSNYLFQTRMRAAPSAVSFGTQTLVNTTAGISYGAGQPDNIRVAVTAVAAGSCYGIAPYVAVNARMT